jgi:hypothetical protein
MSTEFDLCASLLMLRQGPEQPLTQLTQASPPQNGATEYTPKDPLLQGLTAIDRQRRIHEHSSAMNPNISSSSRIKYDDLHRCFHLPLVEVAKRLGVCTTLLKKICRKLGVKKWPHRQIRKIDNCISNLQSAMKRNVDNESDGLLFLEQIHALERVRNNVLRDPNGTHQLQPVRVFTKRKGDADGTRVRAPKQMSSILNKFYASQSAKKSNQSSPKMSDSDLSDGSDTETGGQSAPVLQNLKLPPQVDPAVAKSEFPTSPVSTLISTLPPHFEPAVVKDVTNQEATNLKNRLFAIQEARYSLMSQQQHMHLLGALYKQQHMEVEPTPHHHYQLSNDSILISLRQLASQTPASLTSH